MDIANNSMRMPKSCRLASGISYGFHSLTPHEGRVQPLSVVARDLMTVETQASHLMLTCTESLELHAQYCAVSISAYL